MRALKILAVVLVGAVALLGAALFVLARYLDSEAFRRAAIAAAQETLGASVTVGRARRSRSSRARPSGRSPWAIPRGFPARCCGPRPWSCARGSCRSSDAGSRSRRCVSTLPTVTLARNEHGEWSFERLVSRPSSAPGRRHLERRRRDAAAAPHPVGARRRRATPGPQPRHPRGRARAERAAGRGHRHRGDDLALAGRRRAGRPGTARRRVAPGRGAGRGPGAHRPAPVRRRRPHPRIPSAASSRRARWEARPRSA